MTSTKRLVKDWQVVRDKIEAYSWAANIASKVKVETDWWAAHYEDDPAQIAGWGHNYFCSHCFSPLVFDAAKPDVHPCSKCGILHHDSAVTEAWTASYRSRASVQVFHAAVLYNLHGDQIYMDFIRKVLSFYSDHLSTFKVRTPAGFEGVFTGINLTDAVAICWMLNGMELVREQLTDAELERYKEHFFIPMAQFLHITPGGTPNISCWMKSALGMIGLYFNEREWCLRAADGVEGIERQLAEGLLPQGFWYESSFHYHFYCAEGLTYYAAFCELYDYDFSEFTESIRKMYRYPLKYAFPNGKLPSPNDGWPLLSFANYAHQYEWIRNIYDEAPYRYALAQCYDEEEFAGKASDDNVYLNFGGLPRLLYGTNWRKELEETERKLQKSLAPPRISHYDGDIHYCMLQNESTSVFLKYGFVIREHSHADIMNFELFVKDQLLSRDIANSGYGSELFREWQRKSVAHNTIMVDQLNQPNRPSGKLLDFNAELNSVKVEADDVYPGVKFGRELKLSSEGLHDEFSVWMTEEDGQIHTFDWLFHCEGELSCELPLEPTQLLGETDGYQLMQELRSCTTDEDWEITWVLPDKRLTLSMAGSPNTTVYTFKGCEHRADLMRYGVMVRRSGSEATYRADYRVELL
ncbi:MAG: Heparinase family protein [Paenibacillus sp.]|jgi:hypothetical protein|nr:Heparinase family protein [Paenibacillus sp.]